MCPFLAWEVFDSGSGYSRRNSQLGTLFRFQVFSRKLGLLVELYDPWFDDGSDLSSLDLDREGFGERC